MEEKINKLNNLRHSTAHLFAAAIMELWSNTKITIGPAIETGFYYDADFGDIKISEDNFVQIEQKMRELVKTWTGFERIEVSKEEALLKYKDNPYKVELIEEIVKKNEPITFYRSGNFTDLCRGGHDSNPREDIKHFKLLKIAGAYWRGSEKNKMLTRIYGTAFFSKKELEDYLLMLQEAEKRDHRKIGKELDLFVFSDLIGKGLPLFTPKGTLLRELLNDFSQKLRIDKGFQKVWIPHITKKELYETSGHWAKFGGELFLVKSQETTDEMVMKPMNCPHHQQIYASRPRSYKDLPIKYLETTTIYRDEKAGELLGLSRVRSVTQDDSHTFCAPEQIEEIYKTLIEITKEFYNTLGMKFRARLSFRDEKTPEKYLGEGELWQKAQEIILKIAKSEKLDYFIANGEAAFYGPKIDFMITDAIGREWQLATPQLDFVQPKRFGLTYVDSTGQEQTPVMIHFALMGSLERFLSVYIEHTAGKFPLWLSPVQVVLLPIADRHNVFAKETAEKLKNMGIRVELDESQETLQAKIRKHTLQKVPYLGIIGDREITEGNISIRSRSEKNAGAMTIDSFVAFLKEQIAEKVS